MRFATQALVATAAVGLVAGGSSAFTASNGGLTPAALGQGASVTSGFTVGSVVYALGTTSTDAHRIKTLSFTLTGAVAPTRVKVRLRTADTYNVTCSVGTTTGTSTAVSCDPTAAGDTPGTPGSGILVSEVTTLDILADSLGAGLQ